MISGWLGGGGGEVAGSALLKAASRTTASFALYHAMISLLPEALALPGINHPKPLGGVDPLRAAAAAAGCTSTAWLLCDAAPTSIRSGKLCKSRLAATPYGCWSR